MSTHASPLVDHIATNSRTARSDGLRDIATLIPRSRNPRTHSKKQIEQIAASIQRFGFLSPVLVDGGSRIIAGHGRVEGAKLAGLTQIPVMRVDHLSESEIRAYVIADNKLAENAGWDLDLLVLELKELSVEIDLDITVTGFETAEIDVLLLGEDEAADESPISNIDRNVPPISRAGDLWQIGPHRLLCGNALDPSCYQHLMGAKRARCVFTDVPYNVPVQGHVSGLGRHQHQEFAMASGEMTPAQFEEFLVTTFRNLASFSIDGSLHYQCIDWRHMGELLAAGEKAYSELKNLCVWTKTNAGMGSFYRSQHELVFVFKNGTAAHVNNVELGKHGRNRSNVWAYAGMNAFGKDRDLNLAQHPTVKPLAMVADAILDASDRQDIVLDAFVGSGTTLLAAQKTGRIGFGMEIDPYYVDLVAARFRSMHGLVATLATGETFETIASLRRPGAP
jgi:DNA modification methylase